MGGTRKLKVSNLIDIALSSISTSVQEMSEQEGAGLSFLRLANPLIGVLLQASKNLRELGHQERLEEGWMAVKKALEEEGHD